VIQDELGLAEAAQLRQRALSRWDTEGGAGPDGAQKGSPPEEHLGRVPRHKPIEIWFQAEASPRPEERPHAAPVHA
jgi:hypothetical protein